MGKHRRRIKQSRNKQPKEAFAVARAKMEAGELASARETLTALIGQDTGSADAWHMLGAVDYLMGDSESSAEAFEKAVAGAPSNPNFLNDLASLYSAEQRYQDALPLFERVVQLAPDFVEASYNLATCHLNLHQYERAIPALLNIAEQAPDMLAAAFNLGLAYQRLGKHREALPWLRRASPLANENPSIHVELARCYFDLKDYSRAREHFSKLKQADIDVSLAEEIAKANYLDGDTQHALTILDEIIARNPTQADNLRLLQADIYTNIGQSDAAAATLEKLVVDPTSEFFPPAANLAARIDLVNSDKLREDIEHRLVNDPVAREDEIKLRFGLAQIEDRLSEYTKASTNYRKANDLQAAQVFYDRKALEHTVSQLENLGEVEYKTESPLEPGSTVSPIFVLGMPRSGTSLIGQILNAHKAIRNAGELGYFSTLSVAIKELLNLEKSYPACIPMLNRQQLEKVKKPYSALLQKHGGDAGYVVDKFPENFLHIGLINRLFPDALFVHVCRDPRDVALSVYFQNFAEGNAYCWRLEDIAHYYAQYERVMRVWSAYSLSNLLHVHYSDLVENMEMVTRGLLAKLSLPWDADCLEFYRAESDVRTASHWQVRQPIYRSAINRWSNYPEFSEEFCRELKSQRKRFDLPDAY